MIPDRPHRRRRGPVLAAGLAVVGAGLVWLSLPHPPPALPATTALQTTTGSAATSSVSRPVPAGPATIQATSRSAASTTSPATTSTEQPTAGPAAVLPPGDPPTTATELVLSPNDSPPARIAIPAIDVSADMVDLGLDPDRTLQTPTDFSTAGWFTGGSTPGAEGPAVVAGHVDSTDGPAVFYRLTDLHAGDVISVQRRDGTEVLFTVEAVRQYPKDEFPAADVYRWTDRPTLRLITCGGEFDDADGHYRDNIVVYAGLAT